MASAQYNRYIWLVDTIRSAGKITRAEIDRKWMNSHYNETHEATELAYQHLGKTPISPDGQQSIF